MGATYVYLLHFREPYKHARHYLGFANDIGRRMWRHRTGVGSRLVRAVIASGGDFTIARVWRNGTRTMERQLKNQRNAPRLCPICNPKLRKETMNIDDTITTRALLDMLGISDRKERRNFSSQLYNWTKDIGQKRKGGNITPLHARFKYGTHFVKVGQTILWFPAGVELATELFNRKQNG